MAIHYTPTFVRDDSQSATKLLSVNHGTTDHDMGHLFFADKWSDIVGILKARENWIREELIRVDYSLDWVMDNVENDISVQFIEGPLYLVEYWEDSMVATVTFKRDQGHSPGPGLAELASNLGKRPTLSETRILDAPNGNLVRSISHLEVGPPYPYQFIEAILLNPGGTWSGLVGNRQAPGAADVEVFETSVGRRGASDHLENDWPQTPCASKLFTIFPALKAGPGVTVAGCCTCDGAKSYKRP